MVFEFKVTNSGKLFYLNKEVTNYIIGETSNHDKAHFVFDDSWNDLSKYVTFYIQGYEDKACTKMLDEEDTCYIPWEVVRNSGRLIVSCRGEKDNEVAKTKMESILLVKTPDRSLGIGSKEPEVAFIQKYTERIDSCATKDEVKDAIKEIHIEDYYTKSESDDKFLTEHQSLEDYYTKKESDDKFLTEHQSLENYYTRKESDNKFLTEHQSLENYYNKSESDDKFLTEHQSLENYYTKEESDGKFLAEHQSLADYEKTEDVDKKLEKRLEIDKYRRKYALTGTESGTDLVLTDCLDDETLPVEVKGKTYQNLISSKTYKFGTHVQLKDCYTVTIEDDYINVEISQNNSSMYRFFIAQVNLDLLKPSTNYTVIFDVAENLTGVTIMNGDASGSLIEKGSNYKTIKNNRSLIRTISDLSIRDKQILYISVDSNVTSLTMKNVRLLEGDWTNVPEEEIPKCTIGIHSFAEDGNVNIKYGDGESVENVATVNIPEPLRSLPNGVCDEIVGNKIIRRVGKFYPYGATFGTRDMFAGNKENTAVFRYTNTDLFLKEAVYGSIPISNLFPYSRDCWSCDYECVKHIEYSLDIRISYKRLGIPNTATNKEKETAFNNWIGKNKDFYVLYQKAIPTEEEIDPIILETYKYTTVVSVDDDIPTEISVEYVKDQNKIFKDMLAMIQQNSINEANDFIELQSQIDEISLNIPTEGGEE